MHVVVRGRDVLVADQVADADEVAASLRELGREAVPEVVCADLRGALRLEALLAYRAEEKRGTARY